MLLFVIPVYRVSLSEWGHEFQQEYKGLLKDGEDYQENKHYVHWKYNDVIAWIEISYEVFKVKGRIFTMDKRRFGRNFRGKFKSNHNIGDIDIHTMGKSSEKIIEKLIDRIERYRKRAYPKRFIDTKIIKDSGKYIDFQKMYDDRLPR